MVFPGDLYYHPEHTWARVEGSAASVGITDHAQKELGDIVYVELPKVGRKLGIGDVFGSVESAKSVSELISPVAGQVTEVNDSLDESPESINSDPYGAGWVIRVELDAIFDRAQLLSAEEYKKRL
jgi:glycine cleavage system H protein